MENKYYVFVTKRESQRRTYNVLSFFVIPISLLFIYAVICAVIKDRLNGFTIPHTANYVIIVALIFIGIALAYKRCDDFRGVLLFLLCIRFLLIQKYYILILFLLKNTLGTLKATTNGMIVSFQLSADMAWII